MLKKFECQVEEASVMHRCLSPLFQQTQGELAFCSPVTDKAKARGQFEEARGRYLGMGRRRQSEASHCASGLCAGVS